MTEGNGEEVDPKDELGKRFADRKPGARDDTSKSDGTGDSGNTSDSGDVSDAEQARESPGGTEQNEETSGSSNASDAGNADNTSNMSESSSASESSPASSKPGPDRDENATRHRKQVPMYLPDDKAKQFNELYERLDGRSKVAGEGAIEKHADFMEAVVELVCEHEDDLARKIGIESK